MSFSFPITEIVIRNRHTEIIKFQMQNVYYSNECDGILSASLFSKKHTHFLEKRMWISYLQDIIKITCRNSRCNCKSGWVLLIWGKHITQFFFVSFVFQTFYFLIYFLLQNLYNKKK